MTFSRLLLICLALLFAGLPLAQERGQICVAVYVDGNKNGRADAGEAAVRRGAVVHLLDGRGLTVAAMRLDFALGEQSEILCFDGLARGEYQARLTSSHYRLTSAATVDGLVAPGWPPALLEFGVAPIDDVMGEEVEGPARDMSGAQAEWIAGWALAGLTALLAVFMCFRAVRGRGESRSRRRRNAERAGSSHGAALDDGDTRPTAIV